MPECVTTDSVLRTPAAGLSYPSYGQLLPPFTLSGSPQRPTSLTGLIEYERTPEATTDINNPTAYFADDQYFQFSLSSENIIGTDTSTTLRFNNLTYTHVFTALHAGVWTTGLQVSMLLRESSGKFFHICIPVVVGDPVIENVYLKYWLSQTDARLPAGFSANQLLNFANQDVRFATMDFCLLYDQEKQKHPYLFCLFKNTLTISSSTVPEWLSTDLNLDTSQPRPRSPFNKYRRKTFDEIFNYYINVEKPIVGLSRNDPYLIGSEQHFDASATQAATIPAYFKMDSATLSGIAFLPQVSGNIRALQNVKCYPIDLVTQVNDGNIYIDQTTNKPLDITAVQQELDGTLAFGDTPDMSDQVKQAESQSWFRYVIAFSVIFVFVLAVVIVVVVFFFRGTSPESAKGPDGEGLIVDAGDDADLGVAGKVLAAATAAASLSPGASATNAAQRIVNAAQGVAGIGTPLRQPPNLGVTGQVLDAAAATARIQPGVNHQVATQAAQRITGAAQGMAGLASRRPAPRPGPGIGRSDPTRPGPGPAPGPSPALGHSPPPGPPLGVRPRANSVGSIGSNNRGIQNNASSIGSVNTHNRGNQNSAYDIHQANINPPQQPPPLTPEQEAIRNSPAGIGLLRSATQSR